MCQEQKLKAIDYIRKGWTQGCMAIDIDNKSVNPSSKEAVAFCSLGAIKAAYPDFSKGELTAITAKLYALIDHLSIALWNDHPDRKQEEVVAAFEKADI